MDRRPESDIFTARSKFGKRIRLTKTTWLDKMLKDHPELGARREYIDEVKRTVEDPNYIVSGWFGEFLALRFCEVLLNAQNTSA